MNLSDIKSVLTVISSDECQACLDEDWVLMKLYCESKTGMVDEVRGWVDELPRFVLGHVEKNKPIPSIVQTRIKKEEERYKSLRW